MTDRERRTRGAWGYADKAGATIRDRTDGEPITFANIKAVAEVNAASGFIAGAESEAAHWEARVNWLEQLVSFFASVIKSGEPWSSTCEAEMAAVRASEGSGNG